MYWYRPSNMIHVVTNENAEGNGRTLCGITHEGNVQDIGDSPDSVLPSHMQYCQRCRAAYVKRVVAELNVDVTALSEGDLIEFWAHEDPTDPSSSLCLRKTGEIEEVPPWTETYGDKEVIIEGKYEVRFSENTFARASFDRIWRVNDAGLELESSI